MNWNISGSCLNTEVSLDYCLYGLMRYREDWWFNDENCTGNVIQHTRTDEAGC